MTVGLDDAAACRPFIEVAQPEHPSLIDEAHVVDAVFGVVNIPNAVWIDEEGMIVRPAEPAWPERQRPAESGPPPERPKEPTPAAPAPTMPARAVRMFEAVGRGKMDRTRYVPAVRDWVANGASSRFVLGPDAVIARSQPRGLDEAEGAAHFELAQHLWKVGDKEAARRHFRDAHRLQPDNWTYKRQAWSIEPSQLGPGMERYWQGPVEGAESDWPYEGDFLTDLENLQADQREYYPLPEDMRS